VTLLIDNINKMNKCVKEANNTANGIWGMIGYEPLATSHATSILTVLGTK